MRESASFVLWSYVSTPQIELRLESHRLAVKNRDKSKPQDSPIYLFYIHAKTLLHMFPEQHITKTCSFLE